MYAIAGFQLLWEKDLQLIWLYYSYFEYCCEWESNYQYWSQNSPFFTITIDNGKNGTILNFAQLAEGFSNYFKWQWHFWPPWGTETSVKWEPFDSRMKALLWVSSESWCQVVRRVMMMFWRFKNMAILPIWGGRVREKQYRDTSLMHYRYLHISYMQQMFWIEIDHHLRTLLVFFISTNFPGKLTV